jgi:hypothetical protein
MVLIYAGMVMADKGYSVRVPDSKPIAHIAHHKLGWLCFRRFAYT